MYTEMIDLSSIGRLAVTRAAQVEFDNHRQLWQVRDPGGALLHECATRNGCLEWEREHLGKEGGGS